MFYNVENLFDTINNPTTNDDEYTPNGNKAWNSYKYQQKVNKLYKVFAAVGGYEGADIIGLCEIENKQVLTDVFKNTPLLKLPYEIVHRQSPDKRGIDVALVYNSNKLTLLSYAFHPVLFSFNSALTTREILQANLLTKQHDTIHVFINHWPSRWGGEATSRPKRMSAAYTLKSVTDSLLAKNAQTKIIITGDFNDTPTSPSIKQVLNAQPLIKAQGASLINLSANTSQGTHKYQGEWSVFDQFIVSAALLNHNTRLQVSTEVTQVYTPPFLLAPDIKYTGFKPKRTYLGMHWQNGYSDHLPIYIELVYTKQIIE